MNDACIFNKIKNRNRGIELPYVNCIVSRTCHHITSSITISSTIPVLFILWCQVVSLFISVLLLILEGARNAQQ